MAGAAAALSPLLLRAPGASAASGYPELDMSGVYVRDITFPVTGKVSWSDTYGACRDGCARLHQGQDLFARKVQSLVACVDGTVVALNHGSSGNSLYLRSSSNGWYYAYLHINNDTPGTDDGRNHYGWAFARGITRGSRVRRGQPIAFVGDSGNAETTPSHCHFEMRKPAGSVWNAQAVNPKHSLVRARPAPDSPSAGVRAPNSRPALRKGDGGRSVAALQLSLNYGTGTRLVGDGQFGPATDGAVKHLQRWFRLTVDGVYGPKSQWALQAACSTRAAR